MRKSPNPQVTDRAQVAAGRLRKRIKKLTQQRDYWRQRTERLEEIIRVAPYIEHRFERYEDGKRKAERLRELEVTQAALIREIERLRKISNETG